MKWKVIDIRLSSNLTTVRTALSGLFLGTFGEKKKFSFTIEWRRRKVCTFDQPRRTNLVFY